MGERRLRTAEVAGSNPVPSTIVLSGHGILEVDLWRFSSMRWPFVITDFSNPYKGVEG